MNTEIQRSSEGKIQLHLENLNSQGIIYVGNMRKQHLVEYLL
jgi:hypothetical protein